MEKSEFDRLLQRYVTGNVSKQERMKIEAWLSVMKAERDVDLELDKEAEERLLQRIMNPADSVEDVIALYPRRPFLARLVSNRWVQTAALVIIMVSVSFTVWNALDAGRPIDILTSSGKEKLILNDGTLVWLRRGSEFTYYQMDDGSRRATLDGEGFFEIAKIPNSTFTIACGEINVRVLGTSFSLRSDLQRIELKVLTGKVNLSSGEDSTGIDVSSRETVIYTAKGQVERTTLENADVSSITADTEYAMRFDNVTMDQVIERIERKFDVAVTVTDSRLTQCHVTVDLTDNTLSNTLSILTDVLDVSFNIDGRKVVLSGSGCH